MANDSVGNLANYSSSSIIVYDGNSDLVINYSDLVLDSNNFVENVNITLNVTLHNAGCASASAFNVALFENDPDIEGLFVEQYGVSSLDAFDNVTLLFNWSARIGWANLFVFVDNNQTINESSEANNKANITFSVTGWQEFYGSAFLDRILADSGLKILSVWLNITPTSGLIFVTDKFASVNWLSLQALGKNASGSSSSNDFSTLDTLLNMSYFDDSVSALFTSDGETPLNTRTLTVYNRTIQDVPVINSTNTSSFTTGILWDTFNDSDGNFSFADHEEVVFVTQLNNSQEGAYGVYDYEIKIPVRLREYHLDDLTDLYLYFDLN